jgi:hypothetical protein
MAEYTFETPSVDEGLEGVQRLFRFYKLARGISIVKINGVYSQARYLLDSDLKAFQEVYLGGSKYTVDEATRTALINGGVGVTADNFTAI